MTFTLRELASLLEAAEALDDNGYEILAEQVRYVYEQNGGGK